MSNTKEVGVVVGRFQSPYVHEGYKTLIKSVPGALMLVVGVSGGMPCAINPYDFNTRRLMLDAFWPAATIVPLDDNPSDAVWSGRLDELIQLHFPGYRVKLYGSAGSFLASYTGAHEKVEVPLVTGVSATSIRETEGNEIAGYGFRNGVLYTIKNMVYPTSFQCVDVVIEWHGNVLMGRKPHEELWRFPGGFAAPGDRSLEYAVRREAAEECGDIDISDPKYLCSIKVDDHRYRKSQHQIMTALFTSTFVSGIVRPGDDLQEVEWKSVTALPDCVVDCHKPLAQAYLNSL